MHSHDLSKTLKEAAMRKLNRSTGKRSDSRNANNTNGRNASTNAISLLKADHREVEGLFTQFEKARSDRKSELAHKICTALKAHTIIEEEIFYPAFLEATEETDLHHEAEVEHQGAKDLIAQIEDSGPTDEYYDAKVTVLSEMIKHHVNEEEKRGGMFTKASQASSLDLIALGEQLRARKKDVISELDESTPARLARGVNQVTGSRNDHESARRSWMAVRKRTGSLRSG